MGQRMRNEGVIVAWDGASDRLKLVQENWARLGVTCVMQALSANRGGTRDTSTPSSVRLSTFNFQLSAFNLPSSLFDRILIDAPCSNTGVMRRCMYLRDRIRP